VNEEEFDSLRRWGDALDEDPRPEVRAAGRAIHLLAKEVERLQVELWHARIGVTPPEASSDARPPAEDARPLAEHADPTADPAMESELHSVFARLARRLQATRVFHRG
jgi:hypothetical protein